jgi:hypothetical protein
MGRERWTTIEAWDRIQGALPNIREKLLAYWELCGDYGATDYEAARDTEIMRLTAAATRNGLYHDQLLVDSGTTRDTASGRPAIVWRIPRRGEDVPRPQKKRATRAQWEAAGRLLRQAVMEAFSEITDDEWRTEAVRALDAFDMLDD